MNRPNEAIPDGNAPHEELVAYLDGELDAESRHRLEERLSSNPALRQKLKEFQKAWDLLDELPREQVDDSFTQTTVEMVAVHAEDEVNQQARSVARRRLLGLSLTVAVVLAAGAGGYWLAYAKLSETNRRLVEDLPILDHLDAYQNAGSIDFLRGLEREGLFREEESDAQ